MLRNDGKLFELSSKEFGKFTLGNFAAHPYVWDNSYTNVPSFDDMINYIFYGPGFNSIFWFYSHTSDTNTARLIEKFITSITKYVDTNIINIYKDKLDLFGKSNSNLDKDNLVILYIDMNNATNQEFCRVRYGGLFKDDGSNEIWFRISSIGFNWFNYIWDIVYKNKYSIDKINICYDHQSLNKEYFYKIGKDIIKHFPIDEFIMLKGNPVVESFSDNSIINELNNKSYHEILDMHPIDKLNRWEHIKKKYIKENFEEVIINDL